MRRHRSRGGGRPRGLRTHARAPRGPGAGRASARRDLGRAVRSRRCAAVLLAQDLRAAPRRAPGRGRRIRDEPRQVHGHRVRGRTSSGDPHVAGRARRRRGTAEIDEATGVGGPAPVRGSSGDPREGVRDPAQVRLVGARRGGGRPAREARAGSSHPRGRRGAAHIERQPACPYDPARPAHDRGHRSGVLRRHPARRDAVADRAAREARPRTRERSIRSPTSPTSPRPRACGCMSTPPTAGSSG